MYRIYRPLNKDHHFMGGVFYVDGRLGLCQYIILPLQYNIFLSMPSILITRIFLQDHAIRKQEKATGIG